jgi:ribonuclease P protein component
MPASSRRLDFPRSRRIKQGRDFTRIKSGGRRLVAGSLILNWFPMPADHLSRLGVVTSKRLGGAVVRNRYRRLMREAFRLHQTDLNRPVDLVLVARPSVVGKGFAEVEKDYLCILRNARLLNEKL